MQLKNLSLLAAAGFGLVASVAHAAPVVLNPSFESPAGTTQYGPIDNWAQVPFPSGLGGFPYLSGENAAGGVFWDNGFVPGEGTTGKVGAIQVFPSIPTLSLEQTVAGFDTSKQYILSYYESDRAGTSPPLVEVLVDGQVVVAQHLDTPVAPFGDFSLPFRTETSIPFSTTGTSAVVEIRVSQVLSSDDASATFDDVTITQVTPEPATVGLLGVGALGLLARRRRN